jgi:hypothetical protein
MAVWSPSVFIYTPCSSSFVQSCSKPVPHIAFAIQNDMTALMLACQKGHIAIAEMLVAKGANVEATGNVRKGCLGLKGIQYMWCF